MLFNISDAERNLPNLIQMALDGQEVVITCDNQPVVRLEALTRSPSKRNLGSLQGLVKSVLLELNAPFNDFSE